MLWNKCDGEVNIGGIRILILLPVVNNDAFTEGEWWGEEGGTENTKLGTPVASLDLKLNKSGNEINL